jgi:large subunit ribosomal protein L18
VFRSPRHIYAQVISDEDGRTLVSVSTLGSDFRKSLPNGGNIAAASAIGELVARRCLENSIVEVVFDRNGFLYHGRVKALADAAREAGLKF